ncbi:MAG: toll/interleukin-1 receptor domain-containing protein [Bacteroidota bacterium]
METQIVERKYKVFLSYRHADNREQGRQWATWLHQVIETYEIPKDLVGKLYNDGEKIPERIFPVFRDEEELSADANLADSIINALDNSDVLIVICSPQAVASKYVEEEITYFKQLGKEDNILAMIIEGEPNSNENECFPLPLRFNRDKEGNLSKSSEPIAADFRILNSRDHKTQQGWTTPEAYRQELKKEPHLSEKKISELVDAYSKQHELMKLKIISGILKIPLAVLSKRDKAYQIRLAIQRNKVIRRWLMLVGFLAILAIGGGVFAWFQKQEAVKNLALQSTTIALNDLNDDKLEEGLSKLISSLSEWPDNSIARDRLLFELAYRGWLLSQNHLSNLPDWELDQFEQEITAPPGSQDFEIESEDGEGRLYLNQRLISEDQEKLITRKLKWNGKNEWIQESTIISDYLWNNDRVTSLSNNRIIETSANAEVPLGMAENYVRDDSSNFGWEDAKLIEGANGIIALSPNKKTIAVAGFANTDFTTTSIDIRFFDATTLEQRNESYSVPIFEDDVDVRELYWEAKTIALVSNVKSRQFPRIDILEIHDDGKHIKIENMLENHLIPGNQWDYYNDKLFVRNEVGFSVYQPTKAFMRGWSAKEYHSVKVDTLTHLSEDIYFGNGESWKYLSDSNLITGQQAKMQDHRNIILSDLQGNSERTIETSSRNDLIWNGFSAMGFSPDGKMLALSALNNPAPGDFYYTWEVYNVSNSLETLPDLLDPSNTTKPPMLNEMFYPLVPFGWTTDGKALVFKTSDDALVDLTPIESIDDFKDYLVLNQEDDTQFFIFPLKWTDQSTPLWFLNIIKQLIHFEYNVKGGFTIANPSQQSLMEEISDAIKQYETEEGNQDYIAFLKMFVRLSK